MGALLADTRWKGQPSTGGAARFRSAMAAVPSAVAIVACRRDDRPHGLLVSSLTSLSLEPPRVLFCVRKASACHDPLLHADRASLAVLSTGDVEEARIFSEHGLAARRFASPHWRHDAPGPPRFDGGVINLSGAIFQRISAGTHTIFMIDVEDVDITGGDPLIYVQGDYRRLHAASKQIGAGFQSGSPGPC